jgi:hypothetical protein
VRGDAGMFYSGAAGDQGRSDGSATLRITTRNIPPFTVPGPTGCDPCLCVHKVKTDLRVMKIDGEAGILTKGF